MNRDRDPFLSDDEEVQEEEEEVDPSLLNTQRTQPNFIRLREHRAQQAAADAAAADAAAAATRQAEIDAQNAAYAAHAADQARIAAIRPKPQITDFFPPSLRRAPDAIDPLTERQHGIAKRVDAAYRPVQEPDVLYSNQQHAANAAEEAKARRIIAQKFVIQTNQAQRIEEARRAAVAARRAAAAAIKAAAAARRNGQGGPAQGGPAQGGKRKSLKKKRKNTHKNKINKKKSRRRSRYY
jgi:hypothetical protein